jgi:hypothetical protein
MAATRGSPARGSDRSDPQDLWTPPSGSS